ncbi:unnamed protein product, partial [Amoebophrya sp. A25]
QLTDWPVQDFCPSGKLLADLGPAGTAQSEIDAIVAWYGFDPLPHSRDIEEEVEQILQEKRTWTEADGDLKRIDFTKDLEVFCIDPETAKDLDDAISVVVHANADEQ